MANSQWNFTTALPRLTLARAEQLNALFRGIAAGFDAGYSAAEVDAKVFGTANLGDNTVTLAKLATIANLRVIGNVSGSLATPQAVTVSNDNTMAANSATQLVTQQAVKGYVDTRDALKLSLTGGTMTGDIAMGGTRRVTGLAAPSASADAATKAYVDAAIAALVASSPAALDTLNELADALGDDPNFASTMTTALAGKLSLSGGSMTGTLDMNNRALTNVPTPTQSHHATNKGYVDTQVSTIAGSASAAATSATNAATSATNAGNSATAAAGSATLAQSWANTAEDVVVASGQYSAYHWAKKAEAFAAIAGGVTPVNEQIVAAPAKTTPVDADAFAMTDSASSNATRKVTWANIKATLKTYFDTLYQATSSKLTTLAGQTWAADRFTYYTSASAAAIGTITSFGRSLIDDADAATARATLGLTALATSAFSSQVQAQSGTDTATVMNPARTADAIAALTSPFSIQTGNFAAATRNRYSCNTSAGAITATLAASPSNGDVVILRRAGANTLTVARNGKTIATLSEDLDVDIDKTEVTLTYINNNWEVEAEKYA